MKTPSIDESIFRDYKLWLLKMASVYIPWRKDEWHDLAQEGHIAMWKALRTYDPDKGALPSWLTQAAKFRMMDCARRETWTGTISARGHRREEPALPVTSFMDPDEDGSDFLEGRLHEIDRHRAEIAEGIMLAYHRGEIGRVLSGFSESVRSALYRKFWLDEVVPSSLYKTAIPVLMERLAHLHSEAQE